MGELRKRYDDLQAGGARAGYAAICIPAMKGRCVTRDVWSIC